MIMATAKSATASAAAMPELQYMIPEKVVSCQS